MTDKPTMIQAKMPEAMEAGLYANLVAVWHTPFDFVLDFAVLGQSQEGDDQVTVPAQVVSRVRVPTSVVFQIAKAIADNVTIYEGRYGPITPQPEERGGD